MGRAYLPGQITRTRITNVDNGKQTTMQSQDIKDVLALRDILAEGGSVPEVIASLIEWANMRTADETTPMKFTTSEPVAAQPDPEPPAPRKAPAKATKGRAKPPPPPVDDDDTKEPSPDPSDDDTDF